MPLYLGEGFFLANVYGYEVIQKNPGRSALLFLLICLASPLSYGADGAPHSPTLNMMGEMGLNTVPSARMSPEGTMRFTISRQAPYTHAALGLQLSDRLYVGLRQTSESQSFLSDADHLYPGMDAKLVLFEERRFFPRLAVGVQSAFGHKRMAAEYLAMSKRYENFDFTVGFGWGRMGTRGGLPNPILLNQVQKKSTREIDGEDPNSPQDWFKGDMGIFGGFEYTTPIDGLSVKADWSSDAWTAEKQADSGFKPPAPWSVGLSYHPWEWMDAGVAYAGNNTLMARLSFTPNVSTWPFTDAARQTSIAMLAGRPEMPAPDEMRDDADDEHYDASLATEDRLGLTHILIDTVRASADLHLKDNDTTPRQVGEAARYIANIAGQTPEQIVFHIRRYGMKGVDVTLNRADLERAFVKHHGSSEEIWQTTEFRYDDHDTSLSRIIGDIQTAQREFGFKIDMVNDVSLSEKDSGLLYRTGLVFSLRKFFGHHFFNMKSLRVNLSDNLQNLNEYRGVSVLPVRGDIDLFTQNRVLLEREFLTGFATLARDMHMAISAGYLEEMYMGLQTEILYRPFGKNWAIGAEAALALKRDPLSEFGLFPNGDHILTGFLNGYYEVPDTGTTFQASAGRYLAGDIGGSFSVINEFQNGVILKGDITATNRGDVDVYGGHTNVYAGIHLSLPIGSVPVVPDGSRIITHAAPLGRDSAQRLDNPTPLYGMTEPLSYRSITRHWSQLMPVP